MMKITAFGAARSLTRLALICAVTLLPTTNAFAAVPNAVIPSSPQVLEFVEPTTNATVVLVGSMHYNPVSIELARETIEGYGQQGRLGSVVIESCDLRWNKSRELYAGKKQLEGLLKNEMKTASDAAMTLDRPVVLGDQRINVTVDALKSVFKTSIKDLVHVPSGWKRYADEIASAWEDTLPLGGKGYLDASAFFDPRLLLSFPISLFKYPLSYLVRDPVPTSLVLAGLVLLTNLDDLSAISAGAATLEATPPPPAIDELLLSFLIAVLETVVFARVLLKPLLADRNEVLAQSILEQCQLCTQYGGKTSAGGLLGVLKSSIFQRSKSDDGDDPVATQLSSAMYVPGSATWETARGGQVNGEQPKVVVAVLGMAHCNGIKKILESKSA